jgi:eukaryotic-like serine/threonine-protein kinase
MTQTDPQFQPDSQDQWRHIERLFHVAMNMPEQARIEFLKAEAGSNVDLRNKLLALLDAEPEARGRLDEVVTEAILAWLRSDHR